MCVYCTLKFVPAAPPPHFGKMMTGGSQGGSRRHDGITVLQPCQMRTGWLGCDQEWETNDQRFSKMCARGSQKIQITGREVAGNGRRLMSSGSQGVVPSKYQAPDESGSESEMGN